MDGWIRLLLQMQRLTVTALLSICPAIILPTYDQNNGHQNTQTSGQFRVSNQLESSFLSTVPFRRCLRESSSHIEPSPNEYLRENSMQTNGEYANSHRKALGQTGIQARDPEITVLPTRKTYKKIQIKF